MDGQMDGQKVELLYIAPCYKEVRLKWCQNTKARKTTNVQYAYIVMVNCQIAPLKAKVIVVRPVYVIS